MYAVVVVFCDGEKIAAIISLDIIQVSQLAGDAGYIPVEHMFKEGGYEAEVPYTPSCEKVILNGVNQLVKEVLEKSKY